VFVRYYLLFVSVLGGVLAQTPEATRSIVAEEFIRARAENPHSTPGGPQDRKPDLSRLRPRQVLRQFGLTVWRLRPAEPRESGARILVHEDGKERAWIPERVSAHTPLREGDRIRLSFESAQEGYLYVVDREQYAGGKSGPPYLIFPTMRTRKGDNLVTPGLLVEIPSQNDRPNYLTLRASHAEETGENLSFIVSPHPLEGVKIGAEARALPEIDFARWAQEWSAKVETLELQSNVGKTWTTVEQEAGADHTRLLTQEDPGPQIIYTVDAGADKNRAVLMTYRLRYGTH
jgi:hypothetical protein